MRSWGNSSEKGLNASGSYAKRNEENIRKYFIFQIQLQSNTLVPWKLCKDSVKPIQGCADDLFVSFPFVLRIVYCNVCHHGNNPGSAAIYSRERSRAMQWHHMRWEKVWLQMVGSNRFLPWQLSLNLAKYNENYLTYVRTDH